MAKQLQLRGGTTSEHASFTGAAREVTVDTDKDTFVVHDGSTQGGFPAVTEERLAALLAQGLTWDEDNDDYTRTGSIADVATSESAGNTRLIIQSAMRRCVMNDDGQVVYYLDADDSTQTEFGAVSDLTGGDGQVMVEIPKFYIKYSYAGTSHSWSISPTRLPGYNLHPAFYKNGEEVDYRYIGAYEGIKYDDGTSAYVDGVSAGIDTANDVLSSVSGFAPWTDEKRSEFRTVASNRGTGWRQQDYDLVSAIQLLYLIEYADWYSQDMIGMGRTELTGDWIADSYIGKCGKSNVDGNGTNSVDGDTNDAYMTYRGVENFFGNVWKWVDGINVNDNMPYICNNDTDFADDTTTNYIDLNITLPASNDYQKTLEQISRGFLPASVGGSSSTYITDYYYQNSGWRVALLGGHATYGSTAGVAYWALNNASSHDSVVISGRLAY